MRIARIAIRCCAVMLISSVGCYAEEPLPSKPEPAKFLLVALDQSMALPAKVDVPQKSVGPWDFTGTPFSDLAMVLRVKNVSDNDETFSFLDTWYVCVEPEDGHKLEPTGGRDATRAPRQSDFLLAKPSQTVNFLIECRLSYASDHRLVLWGYDYIGGIWGYKQITPGKYRVYVEYASDPTRDTLVSYDFAKRDLGIDLNALWKGDGKSNSIEIDVK